MRVKWFLTILLVGSALNLLGCAKESADESDPPKELLMTDLQNLDTLSGVGPHAQGSGQRSLLTSIFGGTSGRDVRFFLDERIRYYFSDKELNRYDTNPRDFVYLGWLTPADGGRDDNNTRRSEEKTEVGAANIGTQLWYFSILDQVPVSLIARDGSAQIPVSSSRRGMMLIGPGYRKTIQATDREVELPAAYRQAILVHEARHSDCTGGISQGDLDVVRQARNKQEFYRKFRRLECGHLHVTCPQGHDLAGMEACDDHPWGSYSIGAVFSFAMSKAAETSLDQRILEAAAVDSLSRAVGFNTSEMLRGELGRPDMSSSGLRE